MTGPGPRAPRKYTKPVSRPRFEAKQAARRETVKRLYDMGWSDLRIARFLHVDPGTVRKDRAAMGLPRLFEPGRNKYQKLPDGVTT